jgi:hypothetical protein
MKFITESDKSQWRVHTLTKPPVIFSSATIAAMRAFLFPSSPSLLHPRPRNLAGQEPRDSSTGCARQRKLWKGAQTGNQVRHRRGGDVGPHQRQSGIGPDGDAHVLTNCQSADEARVMDRTWIM